MSNPIVIIARQELLISARNRWLHWFAGIFAVLTVLVAYFGMVTSGYSGFQDFTRTAASITSLAGFAIPLVALILGVFSFLSHREYLDLVVAQPVTRRQILLGKYVGLLLTVTGSSLLGLGLPGIPISLVVGTQGALQYALVVLQASALAAVFCGLALVAVLVTRRRQVALGIAIAIWVFFELVYGILMLGSTLYLAPSFLKTFLIAGLLGNPIDLMRVACLLVVGGPHLFGPGGATLIKLVGSTPVAIAIAWAGLLVWSVVPVAAADRLFVRQDL
jgi:Cu-processing system permease protein